MTIVKAQLNYLRMAPRKVRLVADLIRRKKVRDAENILKFLPKLASVPMAKLLKSAKANARHNFNLDGESLFIKELRVDSGTVLKRYMPKARGMAHVIRKRTSRITMVLGDKD